MSVRNAEEGLQFLTMWPVEFVEVKKIITVCFYKDESSCPHDNL